MLSQTAKANLLRSLRTVHSWLGIIVLPWIMIIGATGFYLNHYGAITDFLEGPAYDERQFADHPAARPTGYDASLAIAATIWPDDPIEETQVEAYHGHEAFQYTKPRGTIIVTQATGHYFVKTRWTRTTFAPDGTRLHRHVYWGAILKQLHTDGWLGGTLGTWLADITALAMLVFGLTGTVLWWMPRAAKVKRALSGGSRPGLHHKM